MISDEVISLELDEAGVLVPRNRSHADDGSIDGVVWW